MQARFEGMNARVLGVSVDHVPCLKAWAESLGGISFPLLSDFWPHGEAARAWGVFREAEGVSERAVFLIDTEGVVRYFDVHDIADQPDNEVLFAELAKLEPEAAGRLLAEPAHSAEATQAEEPSTGGSGAVFATAEGVVMYCRSWCPDCRRARDWLEANGIAYVEIDVDSDLDARSRAESLNEGRLHTPTFEIGDESCVDFRPERLLELLDRI